MSTDRALLVAGHYDLGASVTRADVLARLAKCVLVHSEAYDALACTIFIVIPVRVQSIGLFDSIHALSCDYLLLNEAHLQICHAKLKIDDSAVAVIVHCIVHAGCMHDEREVLAPLVARGSPITE